MVDPWLFGTVFDDGWDLIAPTAFGPDGWEAVTTSHSFRRTLRLWRATQKECD